MKAMPIAEYLQRKGQLPASEEAAPPVMPARRAVANDDPEPDFRKSGLGAALARRTAEAPALVRPLDAASFAPRRAAPPPPPPRAAPAQDPDMEAKLAEAYHRGVQEGLDTGKAEAATARALERAEWQKRAVIEKLDFQMNEFVRLSETVANGFAEIETRIAEAVARVLKPLLLQGVQKQIIEELSENVARLTRTGSVSLLKVRGPERLLSQLKDKIQHLAVEVEYIEEGGVEISVAAGSTEIRSELASWARLIEDLVENG
jgi:flagellar biosynthesis/type III secretory pathway protein FliH